MKNTKIKQALIIEWIDEQLQKHENHCNAQAMAAYMKTTMPFYGVKAAVRRSIAKLAIKKYPIQTQKEYLTIVKQQWNQPYREQKYIAIDIARAYPEYMNIESVPLFEMMIREGAWWDFVDDIAVHLIGFILIKYELTMMPIIDAWSTDSNIWICRTALICQNKSKNNTDFKRLFSYCLQHGHKKEFFIKKAIGWALREYAKTDPKKVYDFIEKNKEYISGLSYKEALKGILMNLLD